MKIRIGHGYDVHQLKKDKDFWVGGIQIPHTHGAVGYSDGDTLVHAICDALLGAANMRDIGYHFSEEDLTYKDIDSKILLKKVFELITEKGYYIVNIDSTVCLQSPKIESYIPEMQHILSRILHINTEDIAIKATTTEKLGFVGKNKGIAAYAVTLIGSNTESIK